MPDPKPRRSIFDTLKKSADGRLGLAEAARMADKISVFPVTKKSLDATPDPTMQIMIRPSEHRSDHDLTPEPTPVATPVGSSEPTPDPTVEPTQKNEPTHEPTIDPTIRHFVRGLPKNKRRFLHFIIDNEPDGDDYIINRQTVAKRLGFTEISVRRYFDEFSKLGFFKKETYRHGVCQGVQLFLIHSRCRQFKQIDPTYDPTPDPTTKYDPTPDPSNDPTIYMKKERKNLSFSLEIFRARWPQVLAVGFGPDQVGQVMVSREAEGKPPINNSAVAEALDRAEWELATTGGLVDLKGQKPVSNVPGYVFKSLVTWGTFRPHPDYALHEEAELAERKKVLERKRKALAEREDVDFEIWKIDQGEAGIEAVMEGFPGGNRDAWLKVQWKKILNKP